MYKLTADQYDAFCFASMNSIYCREEDDIVFWTDSLVSLTAALTGNYPEQEIIDGATNKAKELANRGKQLHRLNYIEINELIEYFIGKFTYDESQAWRIHRTTKEESEELKRLYNEAVKNGSL